MEALMILIGIVVAAPFVALAVAGFAVGVKHKEHKGEKERLTRMMQEHPELTRDIWQALQDQEIRYRDDMQKMATAMTGAVDSLDGVGKKIARGSTVLSRAGAKAVGGMFKAAVGAARKR